MSDLLQATTHTTAPIRATSPAGTGNNNTAVCHLSHDSDLNSHSLFKATPSQTLEARARAYSYSGRGRSAQECQEFNKLLYACEYATGGKLVTWVLAPRDDPTTLDFKCSCETNHRPALIFVPHKDGNSGSELTETTSYAIGSVFTKPVYRGMGYARRMMSLVHWVLNGRDSRLHLKFPQEWRERPEGSIEPGAFSILHSEIGDFYRFAGPTGGSDGWVTNGDHSTIWSVPSNPNLLAFKSQSNAHSVRLLAESDLPSIWARDAELMKKDILSRASSLKAIFAVLPAQGVESVVPLWSKYSLNLFGGQYWQEDVWGAVVHDLSVPPQNSVQSHGPLPNSGFSFVTWTPEVTPHKDIPPKQLTLTRLRATPATLPFLMCAAFDAARKLGLSEVETWNLDPGLEEAAGTLGPTIAMRTERRKNCLGAVKWYLDGVGGDGFEWMFNERYAWY